MKFEDWLLEKLYRAYLEARKGKRKTFDEHRFEVNDFQNLVDLRDSIIERRYKPSRGEAFIIHDPVMREIFAAPFRDRVVHHFLYDISYDWWDKHFIYDSYSCREKKGGLLGQERLEHFIRKASQNYKENVTVIKMDIQGYFMSLNRKKLYERVCWGLDRQFKEKNQLYRTVKYLWKEIIFDDPTKGVKIRGRLSDWNGLPKNKSLFFQPEGQGIVIGNLTSQLLSNIYLDQLDRFITVGLGYKMYGRYVDDFFIVVPESQKNQAIRDIKEIDNFLDSLGLKLHPKKCIIRDAKQGISFLGAVIYPGYKVPGKRLKKKCRTAIREFASGKDGTKIETVVSYMGHLKHLNSKKFLKKVFEENGWDYKM